MMALLVMACTTASPPHPSVPEEGVVSSATYTWGLTAPTDAAWRPEGGWTWTTDLGYVVELHDAQLVGYSVWLEPCPRPRSVGLLDLLVAPAWAGHSVMSNPTASRTPVVLDLTAPGVVALEPIAFAPDRFCKVGALHARGDAHIRPAGHDMNGATLKLRGTWRRGEQHGEMAWTTPIAHSAAASFVPTGRGTHVAVDVRVSLDGLFDGIDLGREEGPRVLRAVLTHLVDHTNLRATRTEPPTPRTWSP